MQVSQESGIIIDDATEQKTENWLVSVSLPTTCTCKLREGGCILCRKRNAHTHQRPKGRRTKTTKLAWTVSPTQLSKFLSPDQNRIQIRDTFCDLFFPPNSFREANVHRMFDNNALATSEKSAMTAAGDALACLQIGMSGSDRGMLVEAHRRYGIAISRLRSELDIAGSAPPTSDMTIAVYLLTACEVYHSTDFASDHWTSHELALLKLLLAAKSQTGDFESAASRFLQWRYVGFPMYALSYGLIQKRTVLFDQPRWKNALGKQRFPSTILLLHVPGCLERLEAARLKPGSSDLLSRAVYQALDLRAEMHDCMLESSLAAQRPPFYSVDLGQYPAFREAVGDLASLYPEVLRFHDLPAGQHARNFWTSLFVLDKTILGPSTEETTSLDPDASEDKSSLAAEIESCVDNLCRSLPYFTSLEAGTVGSLSAFETVYHVEQFFTEHSMPKHIEWCRRIKERFIPGYRIARVMSGG